MKHIYIHFPYCLYKCHYCDFNSHARKPGELKDETKLFLSALQKDWQQQFSDCLDFDHALAGESVQTIFFGGGTPSLMKGEHIKIILDFIRADVVFSDNIEITLEANPGTLSAENLQSFKQAGVNRLSMGVQSFSDQNLQRFGRIHTGEEAVAAIELAKKYGPKELSIDLIFGFPDQSLASWESDLQQALKFKLKHLSCYQLTAEAGTKYTQDLRQGVWQDPDQEVMNQMQDLTISLLNQNEFHRYEISNYAKPGYESRHNLAYWHFESYLGLGPGAWGQMRRSDAKLKSFQLLRRVLIKDPLSYQKAVGSGNFWREENIPEDTALGECLMMGLRLSDGIELSVLQKMFPNACGEDFEVAKQQAIAKGWLSQKAGRLCPTEEGLRWNNQLAALFL
ncbi:MAG: radical SAM family heme chaperone HemW [Deltaproteobacteria bacterium]|nr:radical SAM family heme chaperone HemW [Deltaproteobacteria bacterium]